MLIHTFSSITATTRMINDYYSRHTLDQLEEYVRNLPIEIKKDLAADLLPRRKDFVSTFYFQQTVFANYDESYLRQIRNRSQSCPAIMAEKIIIAYFEGLRGYTNKLGKYIDVKLQPPDPQFEEWSIQKVRAKERNSHSYKVGKLLFSKDYNEAGDAIIVGVEGNVITLDDEKRGEVLLEAAKLGEYYVV